MRHYLDASVLVCLFRQDGLTARAHAYLAAHKPVVVVSDFAALEFSSVVSRLVRVGDLSPAAGQGAFSMLDIWVARAAVGAGATGADVALASAMIRRLDTPLRAADAIHIAIAQRLDTRLMTFDAQMVTAARQFGLAVADL